MAPEQHTKSPTPLTEEKPLADKFDRFHPAMPQIPGVGATPRQAPQKPDNSASQSQRLLQIAGIAAAVIVIGIFILWWMKGRPRATDQTATPAPVEEPVPAPPAADVPVAIQEGPTVAATVGELSKPWAAKKFTFVKPLTHDSVDAMVIRLPGGALWAFSLQEPYGRCTLELVTDLGRLTTQYGFRATHPMVVDPCNNTVYDPTKVGALGGNVWARGEIVQGGGLRPPISIDVQVKGGSIIADRIE